MRSIYLMLCIFCIANSLASNSHKKSTQPNIVFILADDMGTAQLGCYGSKYYHTPNIDKLASQGVRFTNAYAAAAICSPTRASIMTGKYPARLRLTDYIPGQKRAEEVLDTPSWQQFLPLTETTFAEVLVKNGYQTALIGKWHLSKTKRPPGSLEHNPDKQGFQETFVTYKPAGKNLFPWQDAENDAHNVDTITSRSIEFMKQNRNKPFFLMLSHNAIHDPLMSKNRLVEKYKSHPLNSKPENHPVIGAMVESLDNGVGRILNAIDNLGLAENTIVIFFADNGGKHSYASQQPFRSGKGWLYEGGIREPMIVRWPGITTANSQCHEMISSIDFFPTFLEMVNVKVPPIKGMDGVSFVEALNGKHLKRDQLCWHYPHYHYGSGMVPASAIRVGNYKLIEWHTQTLQNKEGQIELYDLKNDVGEQNNLAEEMPKLAKKLRRKLHLWYKEVGAQIPTLK
ncbi:DUF4976 domain-containing protein [Prolixibacteraceae bacterium JC049]|nr:DUF4976 domain-containing protein [Prolixibacteraceae bacterium JC049]